MQARIILDPALNEIQRFSSWFISDGFFESVPNIEFVSRLAFYSVLVVLRELFNCDLITMF